MYKQTIQNIKLMILPLDGIIFDLNKYRYNYYKHYCHSKHVKLDKNEFYTHLSNMYDMYKGLPLSNGLDIGPFNAKIERELSQYLHYKGLQPKEGLLELIEYAHQKNIKVAVISTHRTKDAVEYLKLANIYNKFHFIIGSDTTSMPLPSPQMLETICDYFHVQHKETLVISPFITLTQVAYSLQMNIIYCEDLISPTDKEKLLSFKIAQNLFDVLNILLFDQYEDIGIYSSILGLNEFMSKEELDESYQNLLQIYKKDTEILKVIHETYEYYISRIENNEQSIKDASIHLKQESKNPTKRFMFDDENEDESSIPEQTIEFHLKDEKPNSHISIHTLDKNEENELTLLLDILKQKENPVVQTQPDETNFLKRQKIINDEEDDDDEETYTFLTFIINTLYTISISFLIIFFGMVLKITFIQQFENPSGIFYLISLFFNGYYYIVESLFRMIFDGLHEVVSIIPSYIQYQTNPYFSLEGLKIFQIFVFNSVLIVLIKWIYLYIKGELENND